MVFGWGKKKESNQEIPQIIQRELHLSDVLPALEPIKKEQSEHLITQTQKLWMPITQHIDALLQIAIALEKDSLNTDNIDINIITIVKRGKKQVLATIHKESERNFPKIKSVDDVKVFNRQSAQTLTRIGDILGKQTKVIHIFAKKYAGKLKEILEKFTKDNSQLNRLLNRYIVFEQNYEKITESLHKLETQNEIIQTSTQKISSMNENISKLHAHVGSLDEKISQYKSSVTYVQYLQIQDKLDKLDSKKSEIEHEINNQTILISRPISKYTYGSALDKEQKILVEKFLKHPFDVFLSKHKSELVTILDNVRKAISLGHMSLKEPQKTLSYLDVIVSKLDEFIVKVESCLMMQNDLKEQLGNIDIDKLSNYEKQLSKSQNDLVFSNSRISELQNEIDAVVSNQSKYMADIESALNKLGNTRYHLKE